MPTATAYPHLNDIFICYTVAFIHVSLLTYTFILISTHNTCLGRGSDQAGDAGDASPWSGPPSSPSWSDQQASSHQSEGRPQGQPTGGVHRGGNGHGMCGLVCHARTVIVPNANMSNYMYMHLLLCLQSTTSLVPRSWPVFPCLQYSKAGEGLVSFLMWVTSG